MKRIFLIALPIVLVVGAFAVALTVYHPAPTESSAHAPFRKKTADTITLKGALVEGGVECQRFQSTDGRYYTLTGSEVSKYKNGDAVQVTGTIPQTSFCMQDSTIAVRTISRIPSPLSVDPQSQSGITGTVTLVSRCLDVRTDPPGKCPTKPYSTAVQVMAEDGTHQVTSFVSDKDGKFKVVLPPGTYELMQAAVGATIGYPIMEPQTVVVKANIFTSVDIQFHSSARF